MRLRNRAAAAAALVLATFALAGCVEYVDVRDTITPHAGDAVYANKAIQTINPWPPAAFETDIDADGQRVAKAIRKYAPPDPPPGAAAPKN